MAHPKLKPDEIRKLFFAAAIYPLWLIASYGFLKAVPLLDPVKKTGGFLFIISTTLFMLLAFAVTILIVVQNTPFQKTCPVRRYIIVCALLFETMIVVSIYVFSCKSNFIFIANTVNLIVLAVWTGTWLAAELSRPPEIVLLCIAMSIADLVSLYGGPTMHIAASVEKYYKSGMTGKVPLGDLLLVKVPAPAVDKMLPVVGVADWIIIAFLAGAAAKFKLDENLIGGGLDRMVARKQTAPYLPISFLSLLLTILSAQLFNLFLPALPIIAVFFLSYILYKYPQTRLNQKSDRLLILKFTFIMAICFAILKFGY